MSRNPSNRVFRWLRHVSQFDEGCAAVRGWQSEQKRSAVVDHRFAGGQGARKPFAGFPKARRRNRRQEGVLSSCYLPAKTFHALGFGLILLSAKKNAAQVAGSCHGQG